VAKFMIEVPHDADIVTCLRAVKIFLTTGSHFLTHAEWGCKDGDHRCWIVVDVADKAEARAVLPPMFRDGASIIELNRFTLDEIEPILQAHTKPGGAGGRSAG
jgi:hypothetical protein